MPAKATIAKSQPKPAPKPYTTDSPKLYSRCAINDTAPKIAQFTVIRRQVDTQCVVEGRDEFVQEHFQNLHQSGNHTDEGDEFQEGQVHTFNQRAVFQQRVNQLVGWDGQAEYESYSHAQTECSGYFF